MSKIASILACCVAALIFSLDARALPGLPGRAQVAGSQVTWVKGDCGRGFYRTTPYGVCEPYSGPQAFGLPYVELPTARLPYAELPLRLPYVELPTARLPYVELPPRLPYVELPTARLPYVELPPRLPYVELPTARLPYVGLPVLSVPRVCPYGYSYDAPYHRCVPL
jgi:hypothetical protein